METKELSDRQLDVFELIYLTDKQIGELLGISHKTVSRHVSNMFRKLNVQTRVGILRWGLDNGYKVDTRYLIEVERYGDGNTVVVVGLVHSDVGGRTSNSSEIDAPFKLAG